MSEQAANPFRMLPSVEEVVAQPAVAALARPAGSVGVGRELLVRWAQAILERWRDEIRAGALDAAGLEERLAQGALARELAAAAAREGRAGLVRAINATGVVLHTGLGRAPVHPEAAARMAAAAQGYCVLEVDRESGRRNERDERLSELLVRLTGAEAGIAVNNNAAAVVLLLNTFAAGKETVVSRGELVEIGGSFRMPDVMERAGTRLREVGTTNRTRARDFRAACGPATGLFLKVHTSNFRQVGFTEEVPCAELASLARELGVRSAFDLGSGLLSAPGLTPLACAAEEPSVAGAVASGIDVVTFSGDKLLGGPQAGLVVGRAEAVRALRKNPLYRALRLDKVTLAGLETTLALVLDGRGDELPAHGLLALRRALQRRALLGDLVDESDAVRGRGVEQLPVEQHARRGRQADAAGKPLRRAGAGDEAEADLRHTQARARVGDDEVADQRDLQTAADGVALERGDHRPVERLPRAEHAARERDVLLHRRRVAQHPVELAEIGAGEEAPAARAREDDHADRGILARGERRVFEPLEHRIGQRVDGRVVDGDCGDAVVDGDLHDGLAHRGGTIHVTPNDRLFFYACASTAVPARRRYRPAPLKTTFCLVEESAR